MAKYTNYCDREVGGPLAPGQGRGCWDVPEHAYSNPLSSVSLVYWFSQRPRHRDYTEKEEWKYIGKSNPEPTNK